MRAEEEAEEKTAWMMDYFNGNWHNSWSMLGHVIDKGELDVLLFSKAMSLLSESEYDHMEALEAEADLQADKANQLEV